MRGCGEEWEAGGEEEKVDGCVRTCEMKVTSMAWLGSVPL